MKNKLQQKLIFILMVIFVGTMLAGCSIGMDSLEDILQKNDLTVRITYYSNGGWFNDDEEMVSRDIYYKADSKGLELTDQTQTKIRHKEYVYDGWYTVLTATIDGEAYFVCDVTAQQAGGFLVDGNVVVVESNGKWMIKIDHYQQLAEKGKTPLLALDQKFDFSSRTLVKGEHIYLATKWVPNQKVDYVLITEDCDFVTVKNNDGSTKTVNNGEVIASANFDSNGKFTLPDDYKLPPVDSTDATFVDYYIFVEGATLSQLQLFDASNSTFTRPEDGSNVKVYVKYVKGDWQVVRFAKDVKSIFASPAKSYYISRDIDCSAEKAINRVTGTFSGKIRGNGHVISGVKVQATQLISNSTVALFGTMGNCQITDVTFDNITVECVARPESYDVSIYLFAHAVAKDAAPTLSNVKICNLQISVTLENGGIKNIPLNNDGYDTSSWFLAGLSNQQFLHNYSTVTVENYQLIINNTIVATDN